MLGADDFQNGNCDNAYCSGFAEKDQKRRKNNRTNDGNVRKILIFSYLRFDGLSVFLC